jgi:transcriptional regulator of acetoin/glycerol metabolism
VALLRFNEWNIARVARIKGVTRKTIYDWLARYEIEREKVIRS